MRDTFNHHALDTAEKRCAFIRERLGSQTLLDVNELIELDRDCKMRVFPLADAWDDELRLMFVCHAALCAMQIFEDFARRNADSFYRSYALERAQFYAKRCVESAEQLASLLTGRAVRYAVDFRELLLVLRECALLSPGWRGDEGWSLYRRVWWVWRDLREWIEEESRALEHALQRDAALPSDRVHLALIHMDVLRHADESARRRFRSHWETLPDPHDWIFYAEVCAAEGRTGRLIEWLEWLLPAIRHAARETFIKYCSLWTSAANTNRKAAERYAAVLQELLPRSYFFYTKLLLDHDRYSEWADVTMALGISLTDLPEDLVRRVETVMPACVLPLYHHTIDREIRQKNRTAYRIAVRYLKRLKSLYDRMDERERWQRFIAQTASRYSRLRALQEELLKGKLIS